MHRILFFVVLILTSTFLSSVHADVISREFEMMTGYGNAHLAVEVKDCSIIPVIARALWEIKPGGYIGGSVFGSYIVTPASEMEAGCGILWQQRYNNDGTFSPYWEVEGGLLYTSLKTEEQATQYNFVFQTGVGGYISLNDDLKLDIGYRFRHYSNSAIELPNIGVNHHMLLVGLSWNF
ncbi:MAG: acyloxyacyl hydrolase [Candidatus Ratteibacteria bacterium]|nr:acyloxyacyl hydrolase [Candidatus Ratteibacteria bacterium]